MTAFPSSSSQTPETSDRNNSTSHQAVATLTAAEERQSDSRIFERWRHAFANLTGLGQSPEERSKAKAEMQRQLCEKWKNELVQHSPIVTFMLERIAKETGVNVSSKEHIVCLPCDEGRSGGFAPEVGAVLLCQGNLLSKQHMEDTVAHELIHMYDHCKFRVDWNNLRHHACSEIRANSLGGDCKWTRELRRLNFNFNRQHQKCVWRRAVLSVQANPACPDPGAAERAVNEVWESCFNDTRPFDEIY